ncbi:D-xylose 1-dehydrogenase Gfo6 [Halegenticoccus soli]|uniref:D-xylose 1-dehydrogenase Gfo6 n=1 Tax=Halegenticoccus soli TaxID=1985678 RepID=UPI000C6D1D0C|nr:D-xylose 1-dehydrogenase Gfo6 [Halegenticoccus soli]
MELDAILEGGSDRDWRTIDPEETEPVRFALIGLGWFTRGRVLPALEESRLCDATVLVSGTAEKAERIAADVPGARGITYDDFRDGVARDAYDAVYVATPNALHLDYVETAAEFGADVLVEKPMERSSDRARELIDACDRAGVELMVAYRMHTEPSVRRARELVDAGLIGEPTYLHGRMSQRLLDRVNPDPDQWRLDADLAGGGALFDLGVYPLNTARFLLRADPIAVGGRTRSTRDAFSEVDETAAFEVEFPGGVVASCFASHNASQESAMTVVGTEGAVTIQPAFFQDEARGLTVSRGDGRATIQLDPADQMLEEFDYFADRVRGGRAVYPDGEHGLVDMIAMEAVYESAAGGDEGRRVELEPS